MNKGGAYLATYLASEKIIPGYGGGMSSAKAALESGHAGPRVPQAGLQHGASASTPSLRGSLGCAPRRPSASSTT